MEYPNSFLAMPLTELRLSRMLNPPSVMATVNLLPRPQATPEGLPAEIWTMICLAQKRQDITGDFILDNSDACNLTRASRTIHLQVRDGVEQRLLYRPKFSLSLWSVEKLIAISRDARLRTYVKELEFGPEQLNCWLENLLKNGPHVLRDWKALMNPGQRLYENTSWPIWPVVELRNGTLETLSVQWASPEDQQNWTDNHALAYRAACADQYAFTDGLFKAIASLPNLSKIILDHRPVGPSYQGLFGARIRPSAGTRDIGAIAGAQDIRLHAGTPPDESTWISKLNVDGMILNQVGKELELLKYFAKHVSKPPKQIPFDVEVTAVEPENPIQRTMSLLLVDTDCENWKLISSRVRSLTLDLSGCNLKNWNVGVSAMLELCSSLESVSVRNAQVSIDITTGLLYSIVNAPVQSRGLKKLHISNALFPADVFVATLEAYADTLEDISIDQLCVTEAYGFGWENILTSMSNMSCLRRVMVKNLSFHRAISHFIMAEDKSTRRGCSWLKDDDRASAVGLLCAALQGMHYNVVAVPHRLHPRLRFELLFSNDDNNTEHEVSTTL